MPSIFVLVAQLDVAEAHIAEGLREGFERLVEVNEKDAHRLKRLLGGLNEIAHMEGTHA